MKGLYIKFCSCISIKMHNIALNAAKGNFIESHTHIKTKMKILTLRLSNLSK